MPKGSGLGNKASNSQKYDETNKTARLVPVPPTGGGMYKHQDELNAIEKKALENGRYLKGVSQLMD